MSRLRIAADRCGPPTSGNGGWTAGVLAGHVGSAGSVTVTLRRPPPLDTDLRVLLDDDPRPADSRPGGAARLLDGANLVAEAAPDPEADLEPVEQVDPATASSAEGTYAGMRNHPFPTCFVCGPQRAEGEGLRLAPGQYAPGRTACTWVPHRTFAGGDGRLPSPYVWAALDCPGGWTTDVQGRPVVLGRISARVDRLVYAGERLVVVGAHVDTQGRKTWTGTTVYDAAGGVVGRAAQLWISVDPAAFAT